jgi:hypothetical protein
MVRFIRDIIFLYHIIKVSVPGNFFQIVRRSGDDEKYLALVRHRVNHVCETAWLIIALVAWEGVPATQADHLYDYLSKTLPSYGNETERRCGTNDRYRF